MKLDAITALIDMGSLRLPTFQRGYVWKRRDVSNLMRSLYRGYPIGSLLIWETRTAQQLVKGDKPLASGSHKLLLDGQQRVTSLYGIIQGKKPPFSDADERAFLDLYFNVATEEFEFYGPTKMQNNPRWISVTEMMQKQSGEIIQRFVSDPNLTEYISRITAITKIKSMDFHVHEVSGADRTIDVVVDIFNQVNSGGTKLSKGDLALAKICADWPQAREDMQKRLNKWSRAGYHDFNLDYLLRWINALVTGHSDFAEFERQDLSAEDIRAGLDRVEARIDRALNLIASRVGLDDGYVLGSPNALAAIVRFLGKRQASPDHVELDRLVYWYIHAMLWQRYSGPVETVIRQDLLAIDENDDAVGALIARLNQNRGHLRVNALDFAGSNRGGRFYSLLYMLTRVHGSRDFGSGIQLQKHLLGKLSTLELHHIFPKARLGRHGAYDRNEINAQANFTFLTKETNLQISARLPEDYLPEYESKHPGVLASHWIPVDPALWKIENYRDFLEARRELLAEAANSFLEQLLHGGIPETNGVDSIFDRGSRPRPISIASDEEEAELVKAMAWMAQNGLPQGELGYELVDGSDGQVTILDLAWSQGIQTGKSQPAALLIDEDDETLKVASGSGFACFTNLADLQRYVQRELLGE